MMCFLIPAESPQVSELEESRALREQLSPGQMDRDQLLVKCVSLADRVGVTQGSNTFSGQGQFMERYVHFWHFVVPVLLRWNVCFATERGNI